MLKLQRFDIFGHQALFTDLSIALNYKYVFKKLLSNEDIYFEDLCEQAMHELGYSKAMTKIYFYYLRHGDDDSIPLTLERFALVNRFGIIFTLEPLLKEDEDYRTIFEDDWGFQSDLPDCTLTEFVDEMQSRAKQIL